MKQEQRDPAATVIGEVPALLERVLSQIVEAVAVLDPNGAIRFANPRFARTFGFTREELEGQSIELVWPPENRQDNRHLLREARERGHWAGEVERRGRDGEIIPGYLRISVLTGTEGGFEGFLGSFLDQRELRAARDAAEARTDALRERLKELSCLYDVAALATNPAIDAETYLQRVAERLPPAYQYPAITGARIRLGDGSCVEKGFVESPWVQRREVRADGQTLGSVEVCYTEQRPEADEGPFLEEEGALLQAIADEVGKGATARRLRADLEASRGRLQAIIETIPEVVYIAEASDLRTIFVSPNAEKVIGVPAQALLGDWSRWVAHVHPEDRAGMEAAARQAAEKGGDFELEYRFAPGAGEPEHWVLDRGRIVEADGAQRVYGILSEITERRQWEQTLRHRLGMESLLAGIAADFVKTPMERVDESIDRTLEALGRFTGADRCYLFEFFSNDRLMRNTHEWCAAGVEPQIEHLQDLLTADFESILGPLRRNEPVHIADPSSLPEAMAEYLAGMGIRSLLLSPVSFAGRLKGFIGFDAVAESRAWPEEDVDLLGVAAQSIAGALEHRDARKDLASVNRGLRVLNACNAALLYATSENELLQQVCQLAVHLGGYRMAWIGLLTDEPEKRIDPAWSAGDDGGYLEGIEVTWADEPCGRGPTGTAARNGRPDVCQYIDSDPDYVPWRERAMRHGFRAAAGFPIRVDNRMFGVLSLYSRQSDAFTTDEVRFLQDLANNVGYGVSALRARSEREQALKDLKASQGRFRTLIEAQTDAVLLTDADGVVLFANPAAEQLLNRSRENLVSQPFGLPLSLDERIELELPRPEGPAGCAEMQAVRVEWEGAPAYLVALHDITRRKQNEEEIQASQQRYDLAVRGTSEGIWEWNPQTGETYWSDRVKDLLGFDTSSPEDDFTGFMDRLHGDDGPLVEAAIQRHLRTGESYDVEARIRTHSGIYRWYRIRGQALWDDDGRPLRMAGSLADVTERRQYQEQLLYQSRYDALTDLPNRALLMDRLEQAVVTAERYQRSGAVLFLDLDEFKLINDSFGHKAGDELLQRMAERLTASVYETDTVARYGGDEFVVVAHDLDEPEHARLVGEKILAALSRPVELEGRELRLTASIGASVFPRDSRDAPLLLRNADTAMYQAKESGRNNFQFYSSEMNARMAERLDTMAGLKRALENAEFELEYQPQMDVRENTLIGAEALLRWNDPERGRIPPDQFIPVAEETGLIEALGDWVLCEAVAQARSWNAFLQDPFIVAVNVSPRQLRNPGFCDRVLAILKETGLDPHFLELEVTEGAVMADPEGVRQILNRLRAAGIRIAVDDFGTGYSSLGYLSRLPLDRLKIDRSFIQNVTSLPHDAALARTIISMADAMGMEVLAEGVETEAQLGYLQRNGCTRIQGFLLGRPQSPEAIGRLLRGETAAPAIGMEEGSRTLLLVDDEPNITHALRRLLRREGYQIVTSNDPTEVPDLIARHGVQVLVTDQRMPQMTGTELLSRVKELYPDVVRIVLSGYTDVDTITEAVNQGWIYKFISKPWSDDELRTQIRQAFEHYRRHAPPWEEGEEKGG